MGATAAGAAAPALVAAEVRRGRRCVAGRAQLNRAAGGAARATPATRFVRPARQAGGFCPAQECDVARIISVWAARAAERMRWLALFGPRHTRTFLVTEEKRPQGRAFVKRTTVRPGRGDWPASVGKGQGWDEREPGRRVPSPKRRVCVFAFFCG